MSEKISPYLRPLVSEFTGRQNHARAKQMKAYLKNQFDFFGIAAPDRKEIFQQHKNIHGLLPESEKEAIVKWCWQQPEREWQYFAMEMLGRTVKKEGKGIIDLYQYMIINKSWWDTVDYLAVNLAGSYLRNYPEMIPSRTGEWLNSNNLWLQRTCLLFQLKYIKDLNTELLESFIIPLSSQKEFFIRKAIGWILREYSKTDAEYVRSFVNTHEMSGLSYREALKWLNRN